MIVIKSPRDILLMRRACAITAAALKKGGEAIRPGVSTWEIDRVIDAEIRKEGAIPSFLNYGGFPASACISVNEQVIHGIPDKRTVLREGDIVSIDVGARFEGFNGDAANTFAVGEVSDEALRLIKATKESFFQGIKFARPGNRVSDISAAVGSYCQGLGYGVVRAYTGHGVGRDLHEDPQVPNYGPPGRGARLMPGMTLAIEPMVNMGTHDVRVKEDGWTVVTADGKLSAHYEHTVLITADGCEILTR